MDGMMPLPEGMAEILLKVLKERVGMPKMEMGNWPQLTKLTPEDLLRRRKHEKSCCAAARKLQLLQAQADKISSDMKLEGKLWWAYLHKTYQLSADRNFHITEDGRILMEPRSRD